MGDSDATDVVNEFGSGMNEVARLEAQGAALAPATRMILTEAGLRPGMRVLDLGCGAGDVTFAAAELVGPGGSVTGLDHSPDALAQARYRAGQRGLAQVQFLEGDVHDPAPGGPYDAIVERLTLWQVPDPAVVLRRQATVLRPGGLIVPMEKDFAAAYSEPDLPLYTQTVSWINQACAAIGSPLPTMGRRLWAITEEAGLRPLGMTAVQPHFGPGDETGLAFWLETIRNGIPLLVGSGVVTAEELDIETYEQRFRNAWERTRAVITDAPLMSVWATTGSQ